MVLATGSILIRGYRCEVTSRRLEHLVSVVDQLRRTMGQKSKLYQPCKQSLGPGESRRGEN